MGCGASTHNGSQVTVHACEDGQAEKGETCPGSSGDQTSGAPSAPSKPAAGAEGPGGANEKVTPVQEVAKGDTTHAWKLEELDKSQGEATQASSGEPVNSAQWGWWAQSDEWIQQRAFEILGSYNAFFEHIGLRKGWRTAPFDRDEVQAPFLAAAEVVTLVRAKLDGEGSGGMVLRQLEGSSMNFLWGWSPDKRPGSSPAALEEFFRGLVFATLSDARGLVEGLRTETVEYYVSCHPLLAAGTDAAPGAAGAAPAAASDAWGPNA